MTLRAGVSRQSAPAGDLGPIAAYTLVNAGGMEVRVLALGGILQSIRVPDRRGDFDNVVLGYRRVQDYLHGTAFCGALIGRYANRISGARFTLGGREYVLTRNDGPNHLHGGTQGFHRVVWRAESFEHPGAVGVVLQHTSPEGHEGYPGTLSVRVTYSLTPESALVIDYAATTDKPTPVNLTQHSYFNLGGARERDVLGHELLLNARAFVPVGPGLIPVGDIRPVAGTPFDFSELRPIGARIGEENEQLRYAGGYDHHFVIDRPPGNAVCLAARLVERASGRVLDVFTTEPGVQVYSGNRLGPPHHRREGIALETQHAPDSPNQPEFPSTIVHPGTPYQSRTVFRFSLL